MTKKIILCLLIILLVFCCCTCSMLVPGIWFGKDLFNKTPTPTPLAVYRTKTVKNTPTPESMMEETKTPAGEPTEEQASKIPVDMAETMDTVEGQVTDLRGLKLKSPVNRGVLTYSELRKKVTDDLFADYTEEDAANDVLFYSTLGLIDPDTDLLTLYQDLYSEQIAGYYDQETKEMYVVQDDAFDGMEKMNYAHEFTHVLQDQNYDIENGLKITDEYCQDHSEYCAAVTALMEGDAFASETDWLYTYGTKEDRLQIQQFYQDLTTPIYDSSPDFIKEDLLFPYQKGYEFVETLYDKGGWAAIDDAYHHLPQSTEQILHPELYPDEKPLDVQLPDLENALSHDWELIYEGVLGEWYTQLLLTQGWQTDTRVNESDAREAAAGWGGDHYVLYSNTDDPDQYFMAVEWKWDTHQDAEQFWKTFLKYNKTRWGKTAQESGLEVKWTAKSGEVISIQYTDQGTRWLVASDQETFDMVRPELD